MSKENPDKVGYEEQTPQEHRITINLTSRDVKNLQKGK